MKLGNSFFARIEYARASLRRPSITCSASMKSPSTNSMPLSTA
nr:MAG TPA: hypothetical protein [Caudoviricetes sp.]